jgi:hypothetical protein
VLGQGFGKTIREIEEGDTAKEIAAKVSPPKPAKPPKATGNIAVRKVITPTSADSTSPPKKLGRPLKLLAQRYASIPEMVEATSDPEFAESFKKSQDARKLVDGLTVLRLIEDATQAEMARRAGWVQPKVSRFEAATDADVSIGEVASYCKALGYSVRITVEPVEATGDAREDSGSSSSLASIQILRRDGKPLEGF